MFIFEDTGQKSVSEGGDLWGGDGINRGIISPGRGRAERFIGFVHARA